jgi:hypothetical protein
MYKMPYNGTFYSPPPNSRASQNYYTNTRSQPYNAASAQAAAIKRAQMLNSAPAQPNYQVIGKGGKTKRRKSRKGKSRKVKSRRHR